MTPSAWYSSWAMNPMEPVLLARQAALITSSLGLEGPRPVDNMFDLEILNVVLSLYSVLNIA